MKKDNKHAAITAAQMLINANLSQAGREMGIQIAAHLQHIDANYIDYMNAIVEAVETAPVEQTLPLLMKDQWHKLSRTQQRQWTTIVKKEMADTVVFVRRFHAALSAQAVMIDDSESLRVQAETARIQEEKNAKPAPTDESDQA